MKIKIILIFMLFSVVSLSGQNFIFFSDSPLDEYYDFSWGFVNEPSVLELAGPSNTKFPVSTEYSFSGANSLKLNWNSAVGGDWAIAVAGNGWPGHDIRDKDSLIFYLYSTMQIESQNLPKIFLEDLSNQKTDKLNLGDYVSDIDAEQWYKVGIPISVFIENPGVADLSQIKTIFFGQNISDGVDHTLFFDEIHMISVSDSNGSTIPTTPNNVEAKGFDSHIDVMWELNGEDDIEGYVIYRLMDSVYKPIGTAGKYDRFFSDFIGDHNTTHYYKVTAQNKNFIESEFSSEVSASTYEMTDDGLLTMVQEATFRYFWDYAHPISGLARERYRINAGNTVTSGGSGFGLMAIMVGIERGFITREEGIERFLKIVKFLRDDADRFHGAWSHWINGETGAAIPFSQFDDGGDLVETSFLAQGLLTARQYFNKPTANELELVSIINELWETIDWNFYRKFDHSPYLYWHWSPIHGWQMNFRIVGYMEPLITYILAVASPTNGIPAWCYEDGWVENRNNYENGSTIYGYKLYVGRGYGGPLFFAHYSFLGFDPRFVRDKHANYFLHNKNQTLINRAYCIENPNGFVGYDENTWGLTASDNPWGYSAQAPNSNDNGTITPTAAISSIPYTPEESIAAMKNMYRNYGDRLWGIYGFKDAFNPTENWFAESYLAIDQGPIICMIENYRSELLWNYFMQNDEIQNALDSIGFVEDITDYDDIELTATEFELHQNYPNPFNPRTTIKYSIPALEIPQLTDATSLQSVNVELKIYDILGRDVATLVNEQQSPGNYELT
ncbi:MAG: glucoamylase family protein, partial [Melioribacteraceae bacterium]|nr:glucoamylase family protein [Melioribacteraceae bacterium]